MIPASLQSLLHKLRKGKKKRKFGFTLIELIIVIAIISIVTASVFVSLNPAGRLQSARQGRADQSSEAIAKAIQLYMVDNGKPLPSSSFPSTSLPLSGNGTFDICKYGIPATNNCVNLDYLVSEGYLPDMPILEDANPAPSITGFELSHQDGAFTGVSYDAGIFSGSGPSPYSRPIANDNSNWNENDVGNIDENVLDPDPGDGLLIRATNNGVVDDDSQEQQTFVLENPGRDISQITLHFRGRKEFVSNPTVYFHIGGGTEPAQSLPLSSAMGWHSLVFNGPWIAADFDTNFVVGVNVWTLSSPNGVIEIDTIYAELQE